FLRATPGKMLFKLRVTGALGEPATPGQLWIRWGYRWGFLVFNLLCGMFYPYLMFLYLRGLCLMVFAGVVAYFTMLATSYGWAVYDRWAGTSVTLLGYVKLPPGLGRIIYWTPTQAAGDAAVTPGFPVQPATAFTPPPAPPATPATAMTPPPPVPAGSGAPVGDVPTRVSARRADEGPIPLDEPVPPAPPTNPA
ncbi:MAG TPA: RDD family protein, partial [Tepidisphaeraceae bacterium]|nr:RDD family protein [Tepidisphaeraceae bacterium]